MNQQPDKIRARIERCSKPTLWYSDSVGDEFDVVDCPVRGNCVLDAQYTVWEDYINKDGTWRHILKSDCTILSPEDGIKQGEGKENWFEQNKRFAKWFQESGMNPFTTSYEYALQEWNRIVNHISPEFPPLTSATVNKEKGEEVEEKSGTIRAFGLETRFWTLHPVYGYGCAECCTGDRCDGDCDAKYNRSKCPHCKTKGWIKPEDISPLTSATVNKEAAGYCTECCEASGNPPCCNFSKCEPAKGDRDITNCIHCGGELREINGFWYHYSQLDQPDFLSHPQATVNKEKREETPLTEQHLSELEFTREVIKDREGDEFVWHIKEGISIYDDGPDSSHRFSYATYIKGDGSFKGGYTIFSLEQLKRLYTALTRRELVPNDQPEVQQTQGKGEWIKVEDKLPGMMQECIFTNINIRDMSGELVRPAFVNTGYYVTNKNVFKSWVSSEEFNATHWMPLPTPPTNIDPPTSQTQAEIPEIQQQINSIIASNLPVDAARKIGALFASQQKEIEGLRAEVERHKEVAEKALSKLVKRHRL